MLKSLTGMLLFSILLFPSLAQKYDPASQTWKYEGASLPKYFAVQHFFEEVQILKAMPEPYERDLCAPLGIAPGSPAAEVLEHAEREASALLAETKDLRPFLNDPAEFQRVQSEFLSNKVHGLKRIYTQLLVDLEAAGVSRARVEDFVEEQAAGMSVGASELNGPYMTIIIRDFEDHQDSER